MSTNEEAKAQLIDALAGPEFSQSGTGVPQYVGAKLNDLLQVMHSPTDVYNAGAAGYNFSNKELIPTATQMARYAGTGGLGSTLAAPSADPALGALFLKPHFPGAFRVVNETGKHVGDMHASYHPDSRTIKVHSLDSDLPAKEGVSETAQRANYATHSFGAPDIRSLTKALQEQWPEANKISALRVSGARELAGKPSRRATVPLKPLREPDPNRIPPPASPRPAESTSGPPPTPGEWNVYESNLGSGWHAWEHPAMQGHDAFLNGRFLGTRDELLDRMRLFGVNTETPPPAGPAGPTRGGPGPAVFNRFENEMNALLGRSPAEASQRTSAPTPNTAGNRPQQLETALPAGRSSVPSSSPTPGEWNVSEGSPNMARRGWHYWSHPAMQGHAGFNNNRFIGTRDELLNHMRIFRMNPETEPPAGP